MDALLKLGLQTLHIPATAGPNDPHVNILVTPDWEDHESPLLIILTSETLNLGQFSNRQMIDDSLREGSMVPIVESALEQGYEVMILNPGEEIWDPELKRAVTRDAWDLSHPEGRAFIKKENEIHQHPELKSVEGHVAAIFGETGLLRTTFKAHEDGRQLYVLAGSSPAAFLMDILDKDWKFWEWYLHAIILIEPPFSKSTLKTNSLKLWLLNRARVYVTSAADTDVEFIEDRRFGCPVYISGTPHIPSIPVKLWQTFLAFFDKAWRLKDGESANDEVIFDFDDIDVGADREKEMQANLEFLGKKAGEDGGEGDVWENGDGAGWVEDEKAVVSPPVETERIAVETV